MELRLDNNLIFQFMAGVIGSKRQFDGITAMSLTHTPRPLWLTFDCYGTLIQWDEGLLAHVHALLEAKGQSGIDPDEFIRIYDHHEHRLEQEPPHRSFKEVSRQSLRLALEDLDLGYQDRDSEQLNARISAMPPFPEVVPTLGW